MNILSIGIIRGIHDIASAMWIGGLFFLGFLIFPQAARIEEPTLRYNFLKDIQQRLSRWIIPAILMLLVTGLMLTRASGKVSGPFGFSDNYTTLLSIKHILSILMVIIAILRQIRLRKIWKNPPPALVAPKPFPVYLNLALGILVLILSGMTSVLI